MLKGRCHVGDFKSHVKNFYESLGTPYALMCWLLYDSGQFAELVNLEIDPSTYVDRKRFQLDLAAQSYLRKFKFSSKQTGIDTKKVCIEKFLACEKLCEATNERFRHSRSGGDPSSEWLLSAVKRKIAWMLGNFDFESFFALASWGPGATTSITGVDTSSARKFREGKHISWKLYTAVGSFLVTEYPNWFSCQQDVESLEIRNSSKLLTVTKNAKTDRPICVEPDINIWFQKAIGFMIRRALARAGFDLDDDTGNQLAAWAGSILGTIATVDFSSASDLFAKLAVRELLPADWFWVMDLCRTPCYAMPDGTVHVLEKFSSMGNGYTFEMESLIFVCMALAVHEYLDLPTHQACEGKVVRAVNIFGDDVTLDTKAYDLYKKFSAFLGFVVNDEKSFSSGYYRESCGSHFFNGADVKPIFLKEKFANVKDIYKAANRISDLSFRLGDFQGRDGRFRSTHAALVSRVPKNLRFFGNRESGDCCIHENMDVAMPRKDRLKRGYDGYYHWALLDAAVVNSSNCRGVFNARLRYPSDESSVGNDVPLRRVTKISKKEIYVLRWYNFGPWIG